MKPILQALLLADHVYEDKSGKKIIAGTFNGMVFQRGGAEPKIVEKDGVKRQFVPGGVYAGSPYAYINLTEIRGTLNFALRYVSLSQNEAVFQTEFSIASKDPLETVELVLPLPALPRAPGAHALELLCENEPIGSLRIMVTELSDKDRDNDND